MKSTKDTSKALKKYSHLYNSMNQGVVYQNSDGYITDANLAAQRMLGLSLAQLQGRKSVDPRWKAIRQDGSDFPGDEHPAMLSLKSGNPVRDTVMGIYHPEKDSHVWILVNAEPIFGDDSNDDPTEVYTTFTDITERIIAEKRLKHQSELQTILTDISGSFINTLDKSTDNVINLSLKKLGEYMRADRIYIFDYEHEKENIKNTFEWCNEGIEPQIDYLQETPFSMVPYWIDAHFNGKAMNIPDVTALDKDDGVRQILEPQEIKSLITVPIIDKDSCIGFVGIDSVDNHKIYGDIDENILRIYAQLLVNLYKQVETQQEVLQKQRFLDDIYQSSNTLITIKDTDGKYLYVNKAMEKVIGISSEEAIGKTDLDLYPPDIAKQFMEIDQNSLERDELTEVEEKIILKKEDSVRYFMSNKFPVKNNQERIIGLCTISHEITDRVEAEKKLKETNGKLKNLVNSQTNYVVRVDLAGNLNYANHKYIQDFGWLHKENQIIGSPAFLSIKDYHHAKTREVVDFCIQNPDKIKKVELDKPLQNGKVQNTLWEFVCLTYEDDKPSEIQCMGFDITKEKQVTEKLRQSEKKYKTLFQDSPDGYLILKDDKFINCNHAAHTILGYTKEELIGKSPADISTELQPDGKISKKQAKYYYKKAEVDGNTKFEWTHIKRNGREVLLRVSLTQIIYEEEDVLFVTWHDITRQRKTEERIRLLSEVIEQSPMLVVITNPKGKIEYVNSSLINKIGYSRRELIGKKTDIWRSGYHTDTFYKELWDNITSGKKWTGEFYNKTKAGEYFWEKAVISPITDKNGNIKHFVRVKEDITIIKQAEEERIVRKEAEAANEAKGKFLSRMSHEFRTPLNAIMSYSHILRRNESFSDKQKKQLHAIIRSGDHLLQLIEDILNYSKVDLSEIEVRSRIFSPERVVEDMELMFRQKIKENGISLKFNNHNLPRFISADEGKIRQVLVNILGNAVKFTDHGEITVKSSFNANSSQDKGYLQLSVSDTGPGMTKEEIGQIFTEFAQFSAGKEKGGTGLGMPISQRLIKAMGGTLEIESELGAGTEMKVNIPVNLVDEKEITVIQERKKTEKSANLASSSHKEKIKVLIVDDNEDNRDTLHELIEPDGYDIYNAVDGLDGVIKAKEIVPDIILMDIQMPKLDGYEASMQIKSEPFGKKVKIIAVTASEYERDEQKLSENGLDDYLRKPFQPEELFEKIKYWISQLD